MPTSNYMPPGTDPSGQDGYPNHWKEDSFPKTGWVLREVIDLGVNTYFYGRTADYVDCQMCGHQSIRYVAVVSHPETGRVLRCGRRCASRLTGEQEDVEELFRAAMLKGRCLDAFLKREWEKWGEIRRLSLRSCVITLLPTASGGYEVVCAPKSGCLPVRRRDVSTWQDALLVAFELYEALKGRR